MEASAQGPVAELMTREMGKPLHAKRWANCMNVGSIFRYYAELARDDGGFLAAPTAPGSLQYAQLLPYGISAHIVPYQLPDHPDGLHGGGVAGRRQCDRHQAGAGDLALHARNSWSISRRCPPAWSPA